MNEAKQPHGVGDCACGECCDGLALIAVVGGQGCGDGLPDQVLGGMGAV